MSALQLLLTNFLSNDIKIRYPKNTLIKGLNFILLNCYQTKTNYQKKNV